MSLVSVSPSEWDVSIQSYVLRTNYEEYAVILMKKESSFGPSTTLKLYGMSSYGTSEQTGSGVHQCSSETTPKGSSGPLTLRDLTIALEMVPWTRSSLALQRWSLMAQLRATSQNEHPNQPLVWGEGGNSCLEETQTMVKNNREVGKGQEAGLQICGGLGAPCRAPPMPTPLTACPLVQGGVQSCERTSLRLSSSWLWRWASLQTPSSSWPTEVTHRKAHAPAAYHPE